MSEALRLANELDAYHTRASHKEAAAELRRLHAEVEALRKALKEIAQNATSEYEDAWCGDVVRAALDAARSKT